MRKLAQHQIEESHLTVLKDVNTQQCSIPVCALPVAQGAHWA